MGIPKRTASKSFKFCLLRKLLEDCPDLKVDIEPLLIKYWPTYIPDPHEYGSGDSGEILFDDGSYINWDWDNGDFECYGVKFTYPYYVNDILFNKPDLKCTE